MTIGSAIFKNEGGGSGGDVSNGSSSSLPTLVASAPIIQIGTLNDLRAVDTLNKLRIAAAATFSKKFPTPSSTPTANDIIGDLVEKSLLEEEEDGSEREEPLKSFVAEGVNKEVNSSSLSLRAVVHKERGTAEAWISSVLKSPTPTSGTTGCEATPQLVVDTLLHHQLLTAPVVTDPTYSGPGPLHFEQLSDVSFPLYPAPTVLLVARRRKPPAQGEIFEPPIAVDREVTRLGGGWLAGASNDDDDETASLWEGRRQYNYHYSEERRQLRQLESARLAKDAKRRKKSSSNSHHSVATYSRHTSVSLSAARSIRAPYVFDVPNNSTRQTAAERSATCPENLVSSKTSPTMQMHARTKRQSVRVWRKEESRRRRHKEEEEEATPPSTTTTTKRRVRKRARRNVSGSTTIPTTTQCGSRRSDLVSDMPSFLRFGPLVNAYVLEKQAQAASRVELGRRLFMMGLGEASDSDDDEPSFRSQVRPRRSRGTLNNN